MSNFLTVNGKGGMVMKKSFFYFALSLLTIAAGCHREEVGTTESANDVMEIYASVETVADLSTRTYLEGTEVLWSEGDQIAVCLGNATVNRFNVKSGSEGSTTAVFEKDETYNGEVRDVQLSNNIAWYPFCEFSCASRDSGYMLFVAFPSAQKYAPDSFPEGAFPMVAVTKDVAQQEYSFRNVCGAIMLQLKGSGSIRSVSITGNSSEILAGIASVSAAYGTDPSVELLEDECTTVTLDCGEDGVALDTDVPTSFIIALPPVPFEKGFVITVTDTRGGSKNYVTAKPNPIIRSKIRRMPVQEYDGIIPQAGDYIDEYGINHGQGIEIDGVVWAPVNCGYHATDFKVGKLYQWGRRYGQGYAGSLWYDDSRYGNYSDAQEPVYADAGVSLYEAQRIENSDVCYLISPVYDGDWTDFPIDELWNNGTDADPIKTEYDPCPDGWRVPTKNELSRLCTEVTGWIAKENGLNGFYFCGSASYYENPDVPKVFIPAAGMLSGDSQSAVQRGYEGHYWSSYPANGHSANYFFNATFARYGSEIERVSGCSVRCVKDDNELVPVDFIGLDESYVVLTVGKSESLAATIFPSDATHQSPYWWSDDPSVASVDENGTIKAVGHGTTVVTAMAGMKAARCTVEVNPVKKVDYVDEFSVNQGKGVEIDGVVWAPVNCGYHKADYPYGKLYQWGRRYGQGYEGSVDDVQGVDQGDVRDKTVPNIVRGPVSVSEANSVYYRNCFYYSTGESNWDWAYPQDDSLWNAGTEESPDKAEYDPCPVGWRVPTYTELSMLVENYSDWTADEQDRPGYWFSGTSAYGNEVPQIFLPAAGMRDGMNATTAATARGFIGYYWSSSVRYSGTMGLSYHIHFLRNGISSGGVPRAYGCSVRCVQE